MLIYIHCITCVFIPTEGKIEGADLGYCQGCMPLRGLPKLIAVQVENQDLVVMYMDQALKLTIWEK